MRWRRNAYFRWSQIWFLPQSRMKTHVYPNGKKETAQEKYTDLRLKNPISRSKVGLNSRELAQKFSTLQTYPRLNLPAQLRRLHTVASRVTWVTRGGTLVSSCPLRWNETSRDVRATHRGDPGRGLLSFLPLLAPPNIPSLRSLEEDRRLFQSGGPILGESWVEMHVRMRARVYTVYIWCSFERL